MKNNLIELLNNLHKEGKHQEIIDKIGESIYGDFIKKLPVDKYKFIDASYIVVEPLNRDEILEILK